ncbi:MAG: ATPase, T2SS/T4P/T4SS family [Bacteroidota bacterium]
MKCDTCRELLTAYLKAELEGAQLCEVEEHLATCAGCATESEGARKVLAQLDAASEEPILKIVSVIIDRAVKERASDIHIRMVSDHVKIFYRIDGVMHEVMRLPDYVHQPLVDRLKLMADMALTVRNVPQDGRIRTEVDGKTLDLRVSTVPAVTGASMVIRIFDSSCARLTLDDVYLVGEQREQLNKLLYDNTGMVCVTGPTGSGKTTTLYAILQELNRPQTHCMTIEDPVEYLIEGVTQMHINPAAGMGFKDAMKAVMRQDPDIIMCGEIRDRDTLELCMQAAMWGHLVLTTVHTLDSISVIRRLLDVGAHRFMVSQSFIGATAQRLLRRICDECKEEYEATGPERAWLEAAGVEAPAKLWRGTGCETCNTTGCRGRRAVYEVFVADSEIAEMLLKNASLDEIEKYASTLVKPMRQSAAELVVAGGVAAAEAMRVMAFQPEY